MISAIIPTYNEADQIVSTLTNLQRLRDGQEVEIIVVDGGSIDDTPHLARRSGAVVHSSVRKGRAAQMNYGAAIAKGDILYFLHADTTPPEDFITRIIQETEAGAVAGCFRLKFDYPHWFLKANCWFTRLDINALRFGDQSLFVQREVFQKSGGFREDLHLMEDQEIIHRLKRFGRFNVQSASVTTSARKYIQNGIFRMQGIFYLLWLMYYLGFSQKFLRKVYVSLIK